MPGKVVRSRLIVVMVAVCAVLAAGAESAGAQGWTVQPMQALGRAPDPPYDPGETGFMDAVSCTSADFCAAAGGAESTGPPIAAAEFWDGSNWSLVTDDTGDGSPLLGVSCAAAQTCLAVGYTVHTAAPQEPFAYRLGVALGGGPPDVDDPPEGGDSLNGVSCTSATVCTAVGFTNAQDHSPLLIERADGGAWSLPAPASPVAAIFQFEFGTSLHGISCPSASSCVAVGAALQQSAPNDQIKTTLAEEWHGSAWSLDATPNPAGSDEELNAVSCSSSGDCVAVGDESTPTLAGLPLAERLHRGRWTIMSLPPVPEGSTWASLAGVSCPTARTCTAVGSWDDSLGNAHSLALRLHQDRWRPQTAATVPASAGDALSAVSCPTRRVCTAVGYVLDDSVPAVGARQEPLAERWATGGHGWRRHGR